MFFSNILSLKMILSSEFFFRMHILPVTARTKFHQEIVSTIIQAADANDLIEFDFLKSSKMMYKEFYENRHFLILVIKRFLLYKSLYKDHSTVIWKTSLRILREYIRP